MSEHLPECPGTDAAISVGSVACICPELRAAEARAGQDGMARGYKDGYADALRQAREAINRMPGVDGCTVMALREDGSAWLIRHVDQGLALAAIDGLEKP